MTYEKAKAIFEELPLIHKVACAIFCAKEVYDEPAWNAWADKFLSGVDRTIDAAKIELDGSHHQGSLDVSARFTVRAVRDLENPPLCSGDLDNCLNWISTAFSRGVPASGKAYLKKVLGRVLKEHFICPYCYNLPNQHTKEGMCLFGAHTWVGINNVWRP